VSELKVINNQLGFRNDHGRKRILVPDVPEAHSVFGSASFRVFEQNQFSMHSMNSEKRPNFLHEATLERTHTDFGPWLVGDFSHVRDTGVYQAWCGNTPGPSFAIRDDVWLRILPECIRYFQVQSCGREVVGWHRACHLDDGYIPEQDRYLEAAGGWHDAGDFRKWVTSTAMNAIALLVTHRIWSGREDKLGIARGLLLAEALQGVHYFLGVQEDSGRLFQNIGGGARSVHDNEDNRYTDNVPRSGDERRIHPGPTATPPKCTALFALYAGALAESDPDLSARCLAAALKSHSYDLSVPDDSTDQLQWQAWALLELWRCTGEDTRRAEALAVLDALLSRQVTDYVGGQKLTRGFFRTEADGDEYHRKHVGADYVIWVIAEFLAAWPDHPDATRWRDAIAMWADDYVRVFADRNPFGLLPYSLYPAPSAEHPHHHYRRLGDGLCFRYFLAGEKFGTNARCGLSAAALAAAAGALGRPELLDDGYRLLEWVVGNNPYQMSTINGVGVLQPCALSFQMGNIPGGVTMGIMGDEADMPWYPHPWACTDEYYGYQTSQFLWGLLALQDQAYPA